MYNNSMNSNMNNNRMYNSGRMYTYNSKNNNRAHSGRMRRKISLSIISMITAVVLLASDVLPFVPISAYAEELIAYKTAAAEAIADSVIEEGYEYLSLEMYPGDDEASETVTLEGVMPEGAEAEAVNVTEEFSDIENVVEIPEGSAGIKEDVKEEDVTETPSEEQQEGLSVIAAYDITISDSEGGEYQPEADKPISVEIVNPDITLEQYIEVWHIRDDGTSEKVRDFTVEDGKITFEASGFSVYAIVKVSGGISGTFEAVPVDGDTSFSVLETEPAGTSPDYVYNVVSNTYGSIPGVPEHITTLDGIFANKDTGLYISSERYKFYAKNFQENNIKSKNRSGIAVTPEHGDVIEAYNDGAKLFYFEEVDSANALYKIYTYADDGTTKKYVGHKNSDATNNRLYLTNDPNNTSYTEETVWKIIINGNNVRFKDNSSGWYWCESLGTNSYPTNGIVAYSNAGDGGAQFNLWSYTPAATIAEDPYDLDGKTYGLVNFENATLGHALQAGVRKDNATALGNVNVTRSTDAGTGAVSYTSSYGISGWKFEWVEGTLTYLVSAIAENGAERKYLKLDGTGLYLVDESEATPLTVVPDRATGRIKLTETTSNSSIFRNGSTDFKRGTDGNTTDKYFDLVDVLSAAADQAALNGKTYCLINHKSDTEGYAMMAAAYTDTTLTKQKTGVSASPEGYIYYGNLTEWTFENIDSDRYVISTGSGENKKYLKLIKGSLTVSDDPYIVTVVTGTGDNEGKIKLYNATDEYEIYLNGTTSFNTTGTISSDPNRWFDCVVNKEGPSEDPFGLDGNTYGIVGMNGTKYYAMLDEQNSNKLGNGELTYVSDANEFTTNKTVVPGWTFHWIDKTTYTVSSAVTGKYLKLDTSGVYLADESEATEFAVLTDGEGRIKLYVPGIGKALTCWNTFQSDNDKTDRNRYFDLVELDEQNDQDDPYELDGKYYGIMYYPGETFGNALMADGEKNSQTVLSVTIRPKEGVTTGNTYYVPQDTAITFWSFHNVSGDTYTVSCGEGGNTKYMKLDGENILLTSDESEATKFRVIPDSSGRLELKDKLTGKFVVYDDANDTFMASTSPSNNTQWLNILDEIELIQNDYVTYTADKIGIYRPLGPDDDKAARNGDELIVYTRVWNEKKLKYEFFAIDQDGSLVECYERGDNIMWVGDKINTLIWDFTEYYYEGTDTPNKYYELYNSYSGKYLAPQVHNDQVLSDNKIGLNMPGREDDNYYTSILAWDDPNYAYSGLKANVIWDEEGNFIGGEMVPCSTKEAADFYFATMEPVTNDANRLTPVNTLMNEAYGIKMKMVDFNGATDTYNGTVTTTQQHEVMGYSKYTSMDQTSNLLTNYIDENGYPIATRTDRSLGELFGAATTVDKLFLQSIYEATGYFEYDSCQNFATLTPDGTTTGTNFTVYKELGSMDTGPGVSNKNSMKHGQFMPYNYITAGKYARTNAQNLFDSEQNELSNSDPRKYEKLHLVENADHYFGMELEASFIQTPSGLDNWGHDIIFEFTGDDDFWLYVDDELVIDLGGVHSALAANVNFRTGVVNVNNQQTSLRELFESNYRTRNPGKTDQEVETYLNGIFKSFTENGTTYYTFKDYSPHTMKLYYMERGAGASNLHMRFNLAYVTPGTVLFNKKVSGSEDIDIDEIEYPFQIWYKLPDPNATEENPGLATEHLMDASDPDPLVGVRYQFSAETLTPIDSYTTNDGITYSSVYMVSPNKPIEIRFPDETMEYRIVECGSNNSVYSDVEVLLDGSEIDPIVTPDAGGHRTNYSTDWISVNEGKTLVFDNKVDQDGVHSLEITKRLYNSDGQEIPNGSDEDDTEFSFRLYLSNSEGTDLELANMAKYRVKDPDGYYCVWNASRQKFDSTNVTDFSVFSEQEKERATFETSINGSISKIPAKYTIEVPGLTIDTVYKVEERDWEVPLGYELSSYRRVETNTVTESETEAAVNNGTIKKNTDSEVIVNNTRGYGLQADKAWSDKDFVESHGTIYTAVYIDGEFEPGTVKQIKDPDTSVRYYFDTLKPGKTLANYAIYEVEPQNPQFDSDNNLTGCDGVRVKYPENGTISVGSTALGASSSTPHDYTVSYTTGENTGYLKNARTDTITNTRGGGIVMTLYRMGTDTVLKDGKFTLKQGDTTVGYFTSDANGRITIMYDYIPGATYTLIETEAPDKYIGLPNPVTFSVDAEGNVTIGGNEERWQRGYKASSSDNGIVAYIDVYNPQFMFKVIKINSEKGYPVAGAHFKLFRSVKNAVGGEAKDYFPMNGYDNLVTAADGIVPGVNEHLPSGTYYLTEDQAPNNYEGIKSDIKFTIDPLGSVTIDSLGHYSYLTTEWDEYGDCEYVIRVPNTKTVKTSELTLTKTVAGSLGNRRKEFTFTLTVAGDTDNPGGYAWTKNGITQDPIPSGVNGGQFTMKHNDVVVITLPNENEVTITEASEGYDVMFELGGVRERTNTKTFTLPDDNTLDVTNTLDAEVPTGLKLDTTVTVLMFISVIACIGFVLRRQKKYKRRRAEWDRIA